MQPDIYAVMESIIGVWWFFATFPFVLRGPVDYRKYRTSIVLIIYAIALLGLIVKFFYESALYTIKTVE